jgi:uncharacterized protein (DUF697 family)/predicted GTPase
MAVELDKNKLASAGENISQSGSGEDSRNSNSANEDDNENNWPSAVQSTVDRLWREIDKKTRAVVKLPKWDGDRKDIFAPIKEKLTVSDRELTEILQEIRAKLPTTEAIFIGKPQSGKSSIVRGLTGAPADIVGVGFRPHTQHTTQYAYPNTDLPLLLFTDTVGLGDIDRQTQTIALELTDSFAKTQRARIFIVTVKISDFAIDSLRSILQTLQKENPQIPCLLAITCLHELYPPNTSQHPKNPLEYPAVARAYTALTDSLKGLYSQSVCLDFTLETDGFTPVFYGLETLRDTLATLLPHAEARAIQQLLTGDNLQPIGELYRSVARRYIAAFAAIAGTIAAIPLPFAAMPVLTSVQISLVVILGKLYGQNLSLSQAGGIVSTIAGGFLAQAIARECIKFIPALGGPIAASWAVAYTWTLGEAAISYFGDLFNGKQPDLDRLQSLILTDNTFLQ